MNTIVNRLLITEKCVLITQLEHVESSRIYNVLNISSFFSISQNLYIISVQHGGLFLFGGLLALFHQSKASLFMFKNNLLKKGRIRS